MQKEIEIKMKVDSLDPCIAKLKEAGCTISDPVTHDDAVFVDYDGDFRAFPQGANFLRIRQTTYPSKDGSANGAAPEKGKNFFTLKRGEEMASIERETEISDPKQMRDSIEFMGYHEAVRVVKTRRKTKYGEYEICMDVVPELGSFIEVEKMSDQDPAEVQKELVELLKTLGVHEGERIINGYDTLMYKKLHP